MKRFSIGFMLLLLVLIVLFGLSTQYRDGFKDDQSDDQGSDLESDDQGDDQDDQDDPDDQDDMDSRSMSHLRRKLPPMVSSCVKDELRKFDDLQ
jgi:hypothetical protein